MMRVYQLPGSRSYILHLSLGKFIKGSWSILQEKNC